MRYLSCRSLTSVCRTSLILGFLFAAPVAPSAAQTDASTEFLVGPVEVAQDVSGIPVKILVNDYLSVVGQPDGLHLVMRLDVNLSDLQQKFPAIFATIPLPGDNCASYKPDNLVVSIPTRELRGEADHATMAISGKVDIWTCLQNPVPKTALRWEVRSIGLGIKTKVPVIDTWPGDPFKTKTASQPFDATLPIYFKVIDAHSVGIVLGKPNVNLTGQYVFITNGILNLARIDINQQAKRALDKAIAPNDLIKTIPDELQTMSPVISNASFVTTNGELHGRITASALIPPEKITDWIKLMLAKKPAI